MYIQNMAYDATLAPLGKLKYSATNMNKYVSMAYDVWTSKMATKTATAYMENIEMAIT